MQFCSEAHKLMSWEYALSASVELCMPNKQWGKNNYVEEMEVNWGVAGRNLQVVTDLE